MPRSDRNGERHEVHWSGAVVKIVRRLQRQAVREGRGDAFLAALKSIWRFLRRDPIHFGVPLFRLPAMRLQVRHGAVWPIIIYFAVNDDESLVFIRGIKLLPERHGDK